MKRIIASVLAVSAIAAAAPAAAQVIVFDPDDYDPDEAYVYDDDYGYRGYSQWRGVDVRIDAIDRRIDVGIASGEITRSEALRLRDDLREVRLLESRFSRNGLTASERADLDERLDRLAIKVNMERTDMDRYGFRGYVRRYYTEVPQGNGRALNRGAPFSRQTRRTDCIVVNPRPRSRMRSLFTSVSNSPPRPG